jgi:hypothetical protein
LGITQTVAYQHCRVQFDWLGWNQTMAGGVFKSMTGGGFVMVSFLLFFDRRRRQQLARMSCQVLGARADGF